MISYQWKVLEIFGDDKVITEVKYRIVAKDEVNSVESEGYYTFQEPMRLFAEMLEVDVEIYLNLDSMQNGVNLIKSGLEQQLSNLGKSTVAKKPWEKPTFKPKL
jgi:hypothetical protein